ncbi:hypothetical protein [Pseudomonas oryzihabitans]|uniref:hypothetical protein n=1 Tax=Pseudomonas oryzihabitans TaxID=47885 RepID=UPI0028AAA15C|nr:hypothetical protein [Pseudomonas oryzihabitans]
MNTCANLFHSESELRAALGSAAILDPIKHPRRWEIAQARKKVKEKTKSNRAAQYEAAQALMDPRALAISLFHSRRRRDKAKYIEANKHLTHQEIADATGWTIGTIRKVCVEYGIYCARPRKEPRHDQ